MRGDWRMESKKGEESFASKKNTLYLEKCENYFTNGWSVYGSYDGNRELSHYQKSENEIRLSRRKIIPILYCL